MTVSTRISLAFEAFFGILFGGQVPERVLEAARKEAGGTDPSAPARLEPVEGPRADAAAAPTIPADTPDRALQMLALLQREGRLVDFLLEDLSAYSDAQIGAAVRDVHAGCHKALERYVTLESIVPGREGEPITVGQDQPIDAATYHLVGNVAGRPPFRGTLLHAGWRASRVELPPLGPTGRAIIAPAEIEVA